MIQRKIALFIGVAIAFTIQSCSSGEKSPSKEETTVLETTTEEVKRVKCNCFEVTEDNGKYSYKGALITGSCTTKNSSDKVTEENEYNNGFIVSKKVWTSANGEMILTTDMKYADGKFADGWITEVKENDAIVLATKLEDYKNGKKTKEGWWLIDGGFSRHSTLTLDKETGWKCEINRSYMNPVTAESKEVIEEFLMCAEKWNIDHFFYIIK